MNPDDNRSMDMDATDEQLTALRRYGVAETELAGLSFTDAEEWIDELRMRRIDAGKFDAPKQGDARGRPGPQ